MEYQDQVQATSRGKLVCVSHHIACLNERKEKTHGYGCMGQEGYTCIHILKL